MKEIPKNLLIAVPQEQIYSINNWWNELSEENKIEIYKLWTETETCSWITLEEEYQLLENKNMPIIGGHFENPDKARKNLEWYEDMYEYLIAHPEVKLVTQFEPTTFHICTAHEQARETIQSGIIPENFNCPLNDKECLMKNILKEMPGKSLVLVPLQCAETNNQD